MYATASNDYIRREKSMRIHVAYFRTRLVYPGAKQRPHILCQAVIRKSDTTREIIMINDDSEVNEMCVCCFVVLCFERKTH